MGRPQWGVSVGVGPIRVSGPAPTWGLKYGIVAGLLFVGIFVGLSHCEKYQGPPPRPTPSPTAVTSSP